MVHGWLLSPTSASAQQYRVTDWREYESGLKSRGDLTVWFSEEASEAWTPPKNGRRGDQPRYSNLAILTALTFRMPMPTPELLSIYHLLGDPALRLR